MYNTVKIGTEFTFRKPNYLFTLEDLAVTKEERKRNRKVENPQIREAGNEIIRWTDAIAGCVRNKSKKSGLLGVEIIEEPREVKQKHRSDLYAARKIRLIFPPTASGNQPETWEINFDLDPNCIELQTDPVTAEFYQRHYAIIQNLIFKTTECEPDPNWKTGGGGHISLDLETAFENNPQYLRNFLVLYAAAVMDSDSQYNILRASGDSVNAPFMHEIGELEKFISVIAEFDQLPPDQANIEWLVDKINKEVYRKMHDELKQMAIPEADAPHYQAVNLEHIINTPSAEQRVELRRFEAQRNVRELQDELEVLFGLLEQSRDGNKYVVDVMGNLSIVP